MRRPGLLSTRWLGVGLASVLAVITLGLALTGRLGLYINPESAWFAVTMAVLTLAGTALSFTLPLGAEADHGHEHGHDRPHPHADQVLVSAAAAPSPTAAASALPERPARDRVRAARPAHPAALAASAVGAVTASGVVLLALVLPPAALSAELAMARDVGAPPLFAGADAVTLAATGDTSSFGIGEWATVFATATDPDAFAGDAVTLTGFVTPGDHGGFDLTRLVITHCVIDAQPASVHVAGSDPAPDTGQWVTITGTIGSTTDGRLEIDATAIEPITEPGDPYEY
ncbi:TIGR03943 family protein [Microbacterium sp. zg.B48]|uniref:TIGR03943 family putative permease subunit n=1 Tax=Microbacterium sp. zg.B48 TaxID=2969408 RepID=UPI00214B844A|nr:TIGR03943 family protein [Microbacterium sp. zg.B48]